MHLIEIPEIPVLRGEKAIKALHTFIDELENQRAKELTKKQTKALIRLAKGLIATIEEETRSGSKDRKAREKRLGHSFTRLFHSR